MIMPDEVIKIDNKDKIRTDVEGDNNINIKSINNNTTNKESTSTSVDKKISELLVIKPLMCLVLQWILLRLHNYNIL